MRYQMYLWTGRRSRIIRGNRMLTALITVMAVAAFAVPASAEPVSRDGFEYFDQSEFEECGLVIAYEQGGRLWEMIGSRGSDQLDYFHFRLKGYQSFTNTVTSKTMTISHSITDKDHRIVDNGDGTLTVTALVALNSTVRDYEGNIVRKRSGTLRFQVLVDHNGTPQLPDDDTVLEELGVIKEAGLDTFAGSEFCEDFLASTS